MLVSAVVLKDRPTNSHLKPFSSRWWRDRSWPKKGPGRASAAGCAQKLCDPGTETTVQRRPRGDQGAKRFSEWAGEPRGAPQVFVCLCYSAGRCTEADESIIKCRAKQWDNVLQMWVVIIKILSFGWVFAGKIMRSQWWCVLTCPNIRRTPKREAWCPCPASWVASHTSVTSQHWQEARADRWAYSDIIDLAGCWNYVVKMWAFVIFQNTVVVQLGLPSS